MMRSGMTKAYSIENGFQITMLFLMELWWAFLKEKMTENGLINTSKLTPQELQTATPKEKVLDDLHYDNGLFFQTICEGTYDDYFEEVVQERLHISPTEQHQGLKIQEDVLFQIAIDFCNFFNYKYQEQGKDSLRFAINWLEDMRKHPEKHVTEWNIWNKVVVDVIEKGKKSMGFF